MSDSNPEWALTKLEREQQSYESGLTGLFKRNDEEFQAALMGHRDNPIMSVDFFRRLVLTAVIQSPKLFECSVASVYKAALEVAQLQLEPNTVLQEAFLIPYNTRGKMECQVQIGKNGWVKLAHRTGKIRSINALPVYQGEEFKWQPTLSPEVIHFPDVEIGQNPKLIAAYAWAELTDGTRIYEILRKREIELRIKKFGSRSPAWKEYPDRMACRSAIKRLIKSRLPVNEYLYEKEQIDTDDDAEIIDIVEVEAPKETVDVAKTAQASAERVRAKIIELNGHQVDEETGEVLSRTAEPEVPDGASREAVRNKTKSSTKISITEFWKKIADLQKFWGCGPSRADILEMITKQCGQGKTLGTITDKQKQQILNQTEDSMRKESESKEDPSGAAWTKGEQSNERSSISEDDIPF